ncbi:MAG: hypothetical protein ACE5IL_03095 [Myxococcota bacterium]
MTASPAPPRGRDPGSGRPGLDARDARLLARIERQQRLVVALGALLLLSGVGYGAWGVSRFDPTGTRPAANTGFDWPVAQMASLFRGTEQALERLEPTTPLEHLLKEELQIQLQLSASLVILLLRLFLGTLAGTAGLVVFTVVVERSRLLGVIARLRAS